MEHRVEVLPVHVRLGAPGRREIVRCRRCRVLGLDVDHQADLVLADRAVGLHRLAVRAQQVMRGDRRLETVLVARCEGAVKIAAVGHDPRFVEGRPQLHAVVEPAKHHARVVGKPVGDVGVQPAAAVVERGRQVPVEERRHGLDAVGEQGVDQSLVEAQAGFVHPAPAFGQDAPPRDAEAVSRQTEPLHQGDVVFHALVVIAGDVAGVAVLGQARGAQEPVPDAGPGAVGQRRPLDLVRRRGGAPKKGSRKVVRHGSSRLRESIAAMPHAQRHRRAYLAVVVLLSNGVPRP